MYWLFNNDSWANHTNPVHTATQSYDLYSDVFDMKKVPAYSLGQISL